MNQYDIFFGGITIKGFSVRDVLSEKLVSAAENGKSQACEELVNYLLRTEERLSLFDDRIGSLFWGDIWYFNTGFQIVQHNV